MLNFDDFLEIDIVLIFGIIILTCIILNILFKKVSMPVIVKRGIIVGVVIGIGFMCLNYIEKAEVAYKEDHGNNFVIGRVEFVSNSINKVNINYINSNIKGTNKGKLTVKLKGSTQILVQSGSNTEKVANTSDLKVGDIVTVYCPESVISREKPEITARKIMKKES